MPTLLPPDEGDDDGYLMRQPCRWCEHKIGRLEPKGGQNCVYCANCGRLAYNAPKSETGEATRSLRSRPEIKPSQRARIFERDNYTCILCHADNKLNNLGHLISVKEGLAAGIPEADLYEDENLATFCEECNAGQGPKSINVVLMYRLQLIHRQRKQ